MSLPSHLLHLSILSLLVPPSLPPPGSDPSLPRALTRAQPVHALAHLAHDFIRLLATAAKESAEHAGRAEVSVWDVGRAVGEFGVGGLGGLGEEWRGGERGRVEGEGEGDEEGVVDGVVRVGELGRGLRG